MAVLVATLYASLLIGGANTHDDDAAHMWSAADQWYIGNIFEMIFCVGPERLEITSDRARVPLVDELLIGMIVLGL